MKAIKIEDLDNVGIVIQNSNKGDLISVLDTQIKAQDDIPTGHKVALENIKKGGMILKYSVPIGKAKQDIFVGEFVHSHNIEDITTEIGRKQRELYLERGE